MFRIIIYAKSMSPFGKTVMEYTKLVVMGCLMKTYIFIYFGLDQIECIFLVGEWGPFKWILSPKDFGFMVGHVGQSNHAMHHMAAADTCLTLE